MKRLLQLVGKSRGLQILMATSFLITGVIVVYAVHTNYSNEKALESALEDKIRFALWVYGTTAEEKLRQSSFQTLRDILESVEEHDGKLSITLNPENYNATKKENESSECSNNYLKPVQSVFVYNLGSGQMASNTVDKRGENKFNNWIKDEISDLSAATGELYKKFYVEEEGKEYMVVMARLSGLFQSNQELVFGVKTAVKNLERLFKKIWEDKKIIPGSVTKHKAANEIMSIKVFTDSGSSVFASGKRTSERISVERKVGGEFNFLKGKMAISNPSRSNLAGAGLHGESNIILMFLFAIASALGIIAYIQFRNESKLIRMKRELISNVSHELRTPVTQIRMFSETLLKGRVRNKTEVEKSLQVIDKESKRLSRLITNILDFSATENSILETSPQRIQVDEQIRQVVEAFAPLADSASNKIELDLEVVSAYLDQLAFKQILTNVLDNAVKYGPEGQQVDIRLRKHENNIVLSVADEGPGIQEEMQDKVWEPSWRQNDTPSSSTSGSGIGLSVVQQYLKQMNGSAKITNRKEQGTKFIFKFPIDQRGGENDRGNQ